MKSRIINSKKTLILLILSIIWAGVIFFFSSQPGEDSAELSGTVAEYFLIGLNSIFNGNPPQILSDFIMNIGYIVRKFGHISEYAIFGMLILSLFRNMGIKKYSFAAVILCFLYACSDELHQAFVPGRGPAFKDVLIDTAGAILGIILIKIVLIIYANIKHKKEGYYGKEP